MTIVNLIILLLAIGFKVAHSVKCYSCSSPQLHLKWPKDDSTNKYLYLQEFPLFANESCESVRHSMPVVDCVDSFCIKAVIKQPPAERAVCETGGAIVRDCWSRVLPSSNSNIRTRRNIIRLSQSTDKEDTIGLIYTCDGFLCNSIKRPLSFLSILYIYLLL